ncbi:MAG: hypothetical protein LBS59_09020 [Puniceicoccales bacterium]|jgi:hypothetical protein|nr:hypothetical protein [Puniceicoccales bacterium]
MKVMPDLPEDLYRKAKAKSALSARPPRLPRPVWFGMVRSHATETARHDMASVRAGIVRGHAFP